MFAATARAAPTILSTEYLGPFLGHDAPLDEANRSPRALHFYGTDLGFSYQHAGEIVFLFGDSWATESYSPIQPSTAGRFDDTWGTLSLSAWKDGAGIDRDHLPHPVLPRLGGTDEVAAIDPGQVMDLGKTPLHGFSNGRAEFALFGFGKPQGCVADRDCTSGLACDAGLGYAGVPCTEEGGATTACIDGIPGCHADTMTGKDGRAIAHSGLCVVAGASTDRSERSRLSRVAMLLRLGARRQDEPARYDSIRWMTNRFINATARTVQRFDPRSIGGPAADYRNAEAAGPFRKVLLWGRPGFAGIRRNGHSLPLYFGYADLPAASTPTWRMHYFTGLRAGVPQFSGRESEAVALDLDDSSPGTQTEEQHDIVNQMSVVWIGRLHKWVMLYGGGSSDLPLPFAPACGVLQLFAGNECREVDMEDGAIRMRTADEPWGPWSPAQTVIAAGETRRAAGQYGPGGALHHPDCSEASCASHTRTPFYRAKEYGFFYAANIIEPWITDRAGTIELLWNVSTWDPYRVVLMRTRIKP
ncbi:MAG: DUF4185 domain-containing protein [Steroidobacteraceae bacterium]